MQLFLIAYQSQEFIEEIPAIVRPGCALGVILHGEGRLAFYSDAFHGLIVEIDMCHLQVFRLPDRLGIHGEAMILRSDLRLARYQVLHRVIEPTVPVMHLESGNIIGQRQ